MKISTALFAAAGAYALYALVLRGRERGLGSYAHSHMDDGVYPELPSGVWSAGEQVERGVAFWKLDSSTGASLDTGVMLVTSPSGRKQYVRIHRNRNTGKIFFTSLPSYGPNPNHQRR